MINPPLQSLFDTGFNQGIPLGGQGMQTLMQMYSHQMQQAYAQQQAQEALRQWTIEEQRRQQAQQIQAAEFGMKVPTMQLDYAKGVMGLHDAELKHEAISKLPPDRQTELALYPEGSAGLVDDTQDPAIKRIKEQISQSQSAWNDASKLRETYEYKPMGGILPTILDPSGGALDKLAQSNMSKPRPGKEREWQAAFDAEQAAYQKMLSLRASLDTRFKQNEQFRSQVFGGGQAQPGGVPAATQPTQPVQQQPIQPASQPVPQATPTAQPAAAAPSVDQRAVFEKYQAVKSQIEQEMPSASPQQKRAAIYMRAKASGWTPDELNQL